MNQEPEALPRSLKPEAGSVEIQYFTDPLCCWSWALEPQWRRLRYEFSGLLRWRYRMAGLIPSWNNYQDPMNDVTKPIQMGPLWLEAKYKSGMPIRDDIWFRDPPASSFPACIAVKCAGLQSPAAAENYLRRVREAVMLQGRNIAQWEVLLEIARELSASQAPLLDINTFEQQLSGEAARNAFEEDLRQVRLLGISRYPTLTISLANQPTGVMIVGYRPYEALVTALLQVAPDLRPLRQAREEASYSQYWNGATPREVAEALS